MKAYNTICYTLFELKEKLKLADISCFYDFKDPLKWLGRDHLSYLLNRDGILHSSSSVMEYADNSRRMISIYNKNLNTFLDSQFHNWSEQTSFSSATQSLLHDFGYKNKITLSIELPHNQEIVCRYFIYFHEGETVNEYLIAKVYTELNKHARYLYTYIVTDEKSFSPMISYGIVDRKTLAILNAIANGFSREQAAKTCNLSSRGVDYHLEKLKRVTSAKNNVELVYKCSKMMLI